MNKKIKAIIAIAVATLCAFCPVTAQADRVYFLVGVRHIYEIGPDRDLHMAEREEIEKNYADGVAEDQDTFNKHMANGGDRDKESDFLNKDLDALADARDKSLGSLFTNRDDLRESHPDLKIQGDGPYQVMGIEMHESGSAEVFDRYSVYAPWPDYVVVGDCYGGWDYGVWYEPGIFFNLYWGWWGSFGGFRFCPGFYGHFGRVDFAPHGFADHSRFAASGRGIGRPGFGSSGYSHSAAAATRGWGSSSRSVSGYSHSSATGSRSTGSWSRSSRSSSSTSGYSHSSTSGFSRAATSSSSSRSGYSGYSHSSSSGWGERSSSTGSRSYSHTSGSYSSGGSRSSGSAGWGGGSRSVGSGGSGSGGGRSGGSSGSHGRGR